MNWLPRSAALPLLLLALIGCSTVPPGGQSSQPTVPRGRCVTNPARDNTEGTGPLILLFCVESP